MKKRSKRILIAALCVAIVAMMTACTTPSGGSSAPSGSSGGATAEPSTDAGGEARDAITIAYSSDSGSLNPMALTGQGGGLSFVLCYMDPLYYYLDGGAVEYVLATSVDEVSPLQYTVHLREGVTFSNGNPFTSADVLFSMGLEKDHPSRMLDVQFVDWDKTKATDDYTIDLWFSEYTPYNLSKLAQMLVMDEESFDEKVMSNTPIGTGPYKVTDYVVNSHIKMELREGYWGEPPAIKTLNFKCLNEQSQVTNALEIGDVDVAVIPTKDVEYIESLGNYNINTHMSGMCISSYYNMSPGGVLSSKEARNAISFATDRQAIADVAYNGFGEVTNYPSTMYVTDYEDRFADMDETYSIGYDLEKAKEMAEKGGIVGKTVRIVTNGTEQLITVAEIIQADLLSIGVNAEITNYDQATYYSVIMDPSSYEVALYFTSAPSMLAVDIFANYPTFFTLGWEESERLAYVAKAMDAQATPDAKERGDKLYSVLQDFIEYSPWYGICDAPNMTATASDIENIVWGLAGEMMYNKYTIK